MSNQAGNKERRYTTAAIALATLLAVGGTAAVTGAWTSGPSATPAPSATAPAPAAEAPQAAPTTIPQGVSYADVVSRVSPAVVTIRTERKASPELTSMQGFPFDFFGPGFGQPRRQAPEQRALGSGVIVRADGYILTNNHVVEDATRIQVELNDRRVEEATLVGADPASDLAVVKVKADALPVLGFGDSDRIRVGDVVLAVGNPLGVGKTVTMGIVSAKGRQTSLGDGSFEDFLQTDAPINQGNSGGALVTTGGQLIGINSQILSPSGGNVGIGFAVPSNMAKTVMDQLIEDGRVRRGRLGVTVQTVTSDIAAGLGLSAVKGALVSDVTAGGPADEAGIERGDVIIGLEGHPVDDSNTLRNEVASSRPGSKVTVDVLRDGKTAQLSATLDELELQSNTDDNGAPGERQGHARFGMSVQPVTPDIAGQLDLPRNAKGLVITDVDPSGQAASAGLRPGDVIQQINGKSVSSVGELRSALDAATDKPAMLLVSREGTTVFVPLRAPAA
ncbi:MAG: Do family serine endopeptidase [Vicinamibacterales bacterium]